MPDDNASVRGRSGFARSNQFAWTASLLPTKPPSALLQNDALQNTFTFRLFSVAAFGANAGTSLAQGIFFENVEDRHLAAKEFSENGWGRNRTADTWIFSPCFSRWKAVRLSGCYST